MSECKTATIGRATASNTAIKQKKKISLFERDYIELPYHDVTGLGRTPYCGTSQSSVHSSQGNWRHWLHMLFTCRGTTSLPGNASPRVEESKSKLVEGEKKNKKKKRKNFNSTNKKSKKKRKQKLQTRSFTQQPVNELSLIRIKSRAPPKTCESDSTRPFSRGSARRLRRATKRTTTTTKKEVQLACLNMP